MSNRFIQNFHFRPSSEKLTAEWWKDCIHHCWHNASIRGLLDGKNVTEIDAWASGDIDMTPFKKMYKSVAKEFENKNPQFKGQVLPEQDMQFIPYAALPPKINSVSALIQKNPFEITCSATDAFAFEKKHEDVTFLTNKPQIEADMQDVFDQMQMGKADLGTTKHGEEEYSDSPYGLDLNQPEEKAIFVDLVYKLGVEAAYEVALKSVYDIKNVKQIKGMEIRDHFRYGVAVNRAFLSNTTGLPDVKYQYPGDVYTEHSDLPDYSDNTARFIPEKVTPLELFNLFGSEICSEEILDEVVNGKSGYCECNKMNNKVGKGNYSTFGMDLIYCEVKSIDGVGIVSNSKKSPFSFPKPLTFDPKEDAKCTNKVWAQNTYCAWWLKGTDYFFGIHKLGYATREKGQESYQNFSSNIYKSQEKSAVELSIPENKKAQIASIKMMYALIMSLPAGKYIDLAFLQNAVQDLKEELGEGTMMTLLNLALERNIFFGSTAGMDNNNAGNLKPFIDIPGGLKSEIGGYFQTMQQADQKISQFTGANDQLSGQRVEELVGLQDRAIDGSINALYYINEGIEGNYQKVLNILAWETKQAIEAGGQSRKAIENIIGASHTNLIDKLKEIPLHAMGVNFSIIQAGKDKMELEQQLNKLEQQGILSVADRYMLSGIQNTKKKFAYAAAKEIQFRKRYDKEQQERIAAQQEAIRLQGENMVAAKNAETEGNIKVVYSKGEVEAKLMQLGAELGFNKVQTESMVKRILQKERNDAQLNKSVATLQTKYNLQQQNAYA